MNDAEHVAQVVRLQHELSVLPAAVWATFTDGEDEARFPTRRPVVEDVTDSLDPVLYLVDPSTGKDFHPTLTQRAVLLFEPTMEGAAKVVVVTGTDEKGRDWSFSSNISPELAAAVS